MTDEVLRVRGLTKRFDPGLGEPKVEVLRGLELAVRRGEIFGLLGPNGAGKTTTLKAVMGLIRPDDGTVEVCGRPHTDRDARRRIGFMPETAALYPHLRAVEYLGVHVELIGLDREPERLQRLLERVGLDPDDTRPLRTYSKGMQQRVSLAQALLGEPELLILDEPMSGLDPVGRRDVRDLILAEQQRGTTVFFSSHIIPDVEALCDRIALVVDGRTVAVGTVPELLTRQAEAYEATFTGVGADDLETPLLDHRQGNLGVWVRIAADQRDALVRELAAHDGQLASLTPVRSTVEDFLFEHLGASR